MQNWKQGFIHAVIHTTLWVVGIISIVAVMNHSDARIAYGYLTGWWLALYVGYIAGFKLLSAFIASLIYLCIGVLAVWFDWQWFYKGLPENITFSYLVVLLFGAIVFCSPILINSTVKRISGILWRQKASQS